MRMKIEMKMKTKAKVEKVVTLLAILTALPMIALIIFTNQNYNAKKIESEINAKIENEIAKVEEHYLLKDKEVRFKMKGARIKVFPTTKIIIDNLEIKNIQHRDITFNGDIKTIEIKLGLGDIFRKNVSLSNIAISGADINFEKSALAEYYFRKERVKKMVKLEGNEVLGIKGKLREILTGRQELQALGDDYKEMEVEETVRIDLDNSDLKGMLLNIIKNLSTEKISYDNKNNLVLELADVNLNLVSNNSIVKEYKSITGKISKNNKTIDFRASFVLSNIFSYLSGKVGFEGDKIIIESEISNESGDKIDTLFKLTNNLFFVDGFRDLVGEKKISAKTSSLNNCIQWLLPTTSQYYTKFNYKKGVEFTVSTVNTDDGINIDNLSFKSDDLEFGGSGVLGERNKVDINIVKADMNNFVVQKTKETQEVKPDDINIFRTSDMSELLKFIKNKSSNKNKNLDLNVKMDNFVSETNTIKDLEVSVEINDGFYRIKTFQVNFNDLLMSISGEEKIDDFYISNLKVSSHNIKNILKYLNADSFVDFENFELNSKLFIHDGIVYLKDFFIDNNAQHLKGDVEFSIGGNRKYFASNLHVDRVNVRIEDKQYKTMKEMFLPLSNIGNNTFLNLIIDNLTFNDFTNIYFDGGLNYRNNLLNFYDIRNISSDEVKNVRGKFEIGIKSSKPSIKMSLKAESIALNIDLLDYIVNVNKYKNLILDGKTEESPKYWINKLFLLPNWIDTYGKIEFKINELEINSKKITDFNFISDIDNGSFNLREFFFVGLGGKTELRGKVDLRDMKNVELFLSDTSYNLREVIQLMTRTDMDAIDGIIGINFILKAQGYNRNIFLSSMSLESKFVGRNLYVRKLGLAELEDRLRSLLTDNNIPKNIEPSEIILNNSGTLFDEFSGSLMIAKNILNLNIEAMGKGYSNKLIAKIDNGQSKSIFNFNSISSIVLKVRNDIVPLYMAINFLEDLNGRANMIVDTERVDEYLNLLRKEVEKSEFDSGENNKKI
jgi:hypothetical protein